MRRFFLLAAVCALLAAVAAPAAPATAQGHVLPPLRLITAARFEHVATDDGQVVVVTQGYKESRERFYVTVQNFVTGTTTEVVLYDGQAWLRLNADPEWRSANPSLVHGLVPTADQLLLFDGPLTNLGQAEIAATLTDHYQIWGDGTITDPTQLGFVKVDFFVGEQTRYLYQFVVTGIIAGRDGHGTRERIVTVRFFDHDDPALKVTPPA